MYCYLETLAYCLLPNHFHLAVRVKDKPDNTKSISAGNKTITSDPSTWQLKNGEKIIFEPDKILSELLRRFFTSYSKSINIQEKRMGSLFMKNFKRIEVNTDDYLSYLIYYIHFNPQKHRLIEDFTKYQYSSFKSIISDEITKVEREKVLEWFGGLKQFKSFHNLLHDFNNIDDLIIEE